MKLSNGIDLAEALTIQGARKELDDGTNWCGAYIGAEGETPHVWSLDEIRIVANVGLQILPIWVPAQHHLTSAIGSAQGHKCLAALAKLGLTSKGYSVALDTEAVAYNDDPNGTTDAANAWGDVLASRGYRPVIYRPSFAPPSKYPGWLSSWGPDRPSTLPGGYVAWQWSDKGNADGQTVDMSVSSEALVTWGAVHFFPSVKITTPVVAVPDPLATAAGDATTLDAVAAKVYSSTPAADMARVRSLAGNLVTALVGTPAESMAKELYAVAAAVPTSSPDATIARIRSLAGDMQTEIGKLS